MPSNDTKPRPVSEVARDLGVPRSYIEHWLKTGELDSIRFGRMRLHLVRPAAVRLLMTGTPPPPKKVATCNSLPASSSAGSDNGRSGCVSVNAQVRPTV